MGNYVRRYRDSYLTDRYIRDGSNAAVQRYHDEGVAREGRATAKQPPANGSNGENGGSSRSSTNGSGDSKGPKGPPPSSGGGRGWLNRLPFRR